MLSNDLCNNAFSIKNSLAAVSVAVLLAACGSGSSDYSLRLTGVAATGLAIDGGTVDVQCKSGTGEATTNSAGVYTVNVVNGEGPCLVTVSKGDFILRSIAQPDANGQAVANVTPITSAIVEAIAAAKGVSVTDLTGTQAPSAADISAAATQVVTVLNNALTAANWTGPALTAAQLLSDPTFTAATNANPNAGSVLDQAMDLLIPAGSTSLPSDIIDDINTVIDDVVQPNPTGGTGGNTI